jgi:hypothetical protein
MARCGWRPASRPIPGPSPSWPADQFPPRPHESGCEGSVSAAPDLQLNFEAGILDLTIKAMASEDTTLLVKTPGGQWLCDDDSGGDLNPMVTISAPSDGRYDIWVGTYNDDMVQSTLQISELGGSDSSDAGAPNTDLEPNFGSVRLRSGFTPDPHEKSILAGGSIPASSAKSGCEGKVSAAADYQVFFEPGEHGPDLPGRGVRGHHPADQYAERALVLRRRQRRRREPQGSDHQSPERALRRLGRNLWRRHGAVDAEGQRTGIGTPPPGRHEDAGDPKVRRRFSFSRSV